MKYNMKAFKLACFVEGAIHSTK